MAGAWDLGTRLLSTRNSLLWRDTFRPHLTIRLYSEQGSGGKRGDGPHAGRLRPIAHLARAGWTRRRLLLSPRFSPENRYAPPLSARAHATFLIGALTLAATAFWPQIAHPAFYRDDWMVANFGLVHRHGYLGSALHDAVSHNRPVYVLVNHLLAYAFGSDVRALLLVGLAVVVLVCWVSFVLLCELGCGVAWSASLSLLLLVLPLADSTRLAWTMSTTTLGMGLFGLGAILAVRAMSSAGPRARWLHAAAIVCYLLSLLTYESAAGYILLSCLLYRLVVPWRRALAHWRVDLGALAVLFGGFLVLNRVAGQHVNAGISLAELPHRIVVFVAEAGGALALAVVPSGPSNLSRLLVVERVAVVIALLAVIIHGAARGRRPSAAAVRTGGVALLAIGVGYLPFLVAQGAYHPLQRRGG